MVEESSRDGSLLHYFALRRHHHQRNNDEIKKNKRNSSENPESSERKEGPNENDIPLGINSLLYQEKAATEDELAECLLKSFLYSQKESFQVSSIRSGVLIFAKILNQYKNGQVAADSTLAEEIDPVSQWNFLMISEFILLENPQLSSNRQIIHLINQFERRILFEKIWKTEKIYELIRLENILLSDKQKIPLTLKSPGKALMSMTDFTESKGVRPLEYFFRKLLRASSILIEYLVKGLLLSERCWREIWTIYMKSLEIEDELSLIHNRNILAVISCCVYSMGKMHDECKTFAEIILTCQRIYSDFGEDWYKRIEVGNKEFVDIVQFYNQIYLPKMKNIIYSTEIHYLPASSNYTTPRKLNDEDNSNEEEGNINVGIFQTPIPRKRSRANLTPRIVLESSPGPLRSIDSSASVIRVLEPLGLRTMVLPLNEGILKRRVARKLTF